MWTPKQHTSVIDERFNPKPWTILQGCNRPDCSGKTLHKTLEPVFRDLFPFSHTGMTETPNGSEVGRLVRWVGVSVLNQVLSHQQDERLIHCCKGLHLLSARHPVTSREEDDITQFEINL
ncbi:unnamed protein product [Pleuronectes platessa]|uniref:Uncharacterized protein n=1 Tax=Pleuronectes platessa TaxID=8262 RepID=A0A9N7U6C0_PLEPL|nr:unnamed protein product [Pleuronectes platessa]